MPESSTQFLGSVGTIPNNAKVYQKVAEFVWHKTSYEVDYK